MKTILVVEDEFDLLSTLRAIFEGDGYRVLACDNGRTALELLRTQKPDLALVDVMLPVLSGLEVVRTIKQDDALRTTPVILMSVVPPGVKQADYRWDAFLLKPFSLAKLENTIRQLLPPESAAS